MLLNKIRSSKAQQIAISCLISLTIFSGAHSVFAGSIGGSSIMVSEGPCLYSVQLQKSVTARKKYLVMLSSVAGDTNTAGGPIEEMYGNIKQASYDPDAAAAAVDDDIWGFGSSVKGEATDLDPLSSNCISCHDGAGAVAISVDWRNNPAGLRSLRKPHGTDHPIGMDYEGYVASRRGDYKPISGFNSKMIFVNGRVGCLTCHDPLNQERKHLVMSDRNSALCLTCHGK